MGPITELGGMSDYVNMYPKPYSRNPMLNVGECSKTVDELAIKHY